jgi:hypothetical protein
MKNIFALIASVVALQSFAQNGLETTFDQSCNCNVVTNHFDEGTVSSIHHETLDGRKNGLEEVFYANGQLQYKRNWINNQLDGEGVHYHNDGTLYYKEFYANGVKSGTWSFYEHDGTIMQSITYTGNNADGVYDYFSAGVKYFTQVVTNGQVSQEIVVNQTIYDALIEEAEAARAAGKH